MLFRPRENKSEGQPDTKQLKKEGIKSILPEKIKIKEAPKLVFEETSSILPKKPISSFFIFYQECSKEIAKKHG
jgi:hypothetical protein